MLAYEEYEDKVYDWLQSKRKIDDKFNFSVRVKGSKGAETDYFIGTKKSNYFATTFWTIPVYFPGSSGEAISLIFVSKDEYYGYIFEFHQTNSPQDAQNKCALDLIKYLRDSPIAKLGIAREGKSNSKMYNFRTKMRKESYTSLDEMLEDIEKDLKIIIPTVNDAISEIKKNNPDFKAHPIKEDEFEDMQRKMETRLIKYGHYTVDRKNSASLSKEDIVMSKNHLLKLPLNQILYGPPGTGKTYVTKEKAVNIANKNLIGGDNLPISRKEIVKEYNRLCETGQIVFTTFHQSLSYEDFVEGIKPIMSGKELSYQIEPGIFKNICEKAENDWQVWMNDKDILLPFDEAFNKLREEWEENNEIKFSLKTKGNEYTITDFTDTSIYFKKASGGTGHTLSIATLRKAYHGEKKINPTGVGIYYPGIIQKLKSYKGSAKAIQEPLKHYVLIIDEINRGNVSSIFGELITLLEPDKRLGEKETIKLKLPYSKDVSVDFGVPPNLYIIGTMNTADRSVEALDTALRRRFAFEELLPKPELFEGLEVGGISIQEVLEKINQRIEALVDRDHTIGHAYFFKVKDAVNKEEALKQVFKDNIIPLLQEYFYGDYSRIGLVLGGGFVEVERRENSTRFANVEGLENELEVSPRIQLIPINEAFDMGKALQNLMQDA